MSDNPISQRECYQRGFAAGQKAERDKFCALNLDQSLPSIPVNNFKPHFDGHVGPINLVDIPLCIICAITGEKYLPKVSNNITFLLWVAFINIIVQVIVLCARLLS